MKQNPQKSKTDRLLSTAETVLLVLVILFFLLPVLFFGWYGSTYIPVTQKSEIHSRELVISRGSSQCTLDIPAGELTIRRLQRAVIGSSYRFEANVRLDRPLRFINCTGAIPNWNISLEAQTALVSSNVKPFSSIRKPAFDQDHFTYTWNFTPEERVPQYQSHFWLRAIVNEKEQTVENWNILVRDFPMENITFFGMPAVIGIIISGFSLVFGLLFLILLLQKRQQKRNRDVSEI